MLRLLLASCVFGVVAVPTPSDQYKAIVVEQAKHHMSLHAHQKANLLNASATDGRGVPMHKMVGTFITACNPFHCFVDGDSRKPIPCSSVSAERMESDNSVVTDVTIYVGDYNCAPNTTDVLAKMVLYSTVVYGAMSSIPANKNGKLISYEAMKGDFVFNYQGQDHGIGLIGEINKECPCNGTWHSGDLRTVYPSECANKHPALGNFGDFCNLIVGETFYQTIRWDDYTTYAQSAGSYDKLEGWADPIADDYINALLPESGSTNWEDCTYTTWPTCEGGVLESINRCDTCSTVLECEQCIWQELPEPNAHSKQLEWGKCCPCLYYKAKTAEPAGSLDWLKVHC